MLLVQVHFFWIERLLCLMAAVWPGLPVFFKSFATSAFLGATSHDPQVCRWKRNHFSQLRDTLAAHGNRKSWPGLSKALAKTASPPWSSWPQYGIQWISQRHSPVVFPGRSDPYFKGGRWQLSCWGQEFQDEGVRFRPVPSVTWCLQFWLGTLHCSICQSSWVDSMTHWYRLIPTFLQYTDLLHASCIHTRWFSNISNSVHGIMTQRYIQPFVALGLPSYQQLKDGVWPWKCVWEAALLWSEAIPNQTILCSCAFGLPRILQWD